MKSIKKFFCDVETSGLDPDQNGILEIGGIIEVGKTIEELNYFVKPFPKDHISQAALTANKLKMEDVEKFPEPQKVYQDLTNRLSTYVDKYDREDKFFFIGYNAPYDYQFIRSFFEKCKDRYFGSLFFFPPIDVMQLAVVYLKSSRHQMPDFKLATVLAECGIEVDLKKAHGALYDIQKTGELFYKLVGEMKI